MLNLIKLIISNNELKEVMNGIRRRYWSIWDEKEISPVIDVDHIYILRMDNVYKVLDSDPSSFEQYTMNSRYLHPWQHMLHHKISQSKSDHKLHTFHDDISVMKDWRVYHSFHRIHSFPSNFLFSQITFERKSLDQDYKVQFERDGQFLLNDKK